MKDASLTVTKALPNANAANNTPTIDLHIATPNSDKWRKAYLLITVPALSDHTDTTKTNTFRLQDSADDSSYANTGVQIQANVAGVASTGSAAATFKVPLPPDIRRYVQVTQTVPTGGGTGSNATVTYEVVV